MAGTRAPTTNLVRTGIAGAGLLAAVHSPALATVCLATLLTLITALALIAALSKRKYRRDAAYKIFKLLLDTLRCPATTGPETGPTHFPKRDTKR